MEDFAGSAFRRARDLLITHRQDYEAARVHFAWPNMAHFNWAIDHFDVIARKNRRPALLIVDELGAEIERSFDDLKVASDRAANFLHEQGIRRGDRVLIMLPNRFELWEIMLAAMKIGAVLCPATMILSEADLGDRIQRGGMAAVIVDETCTSRFKGLADACVRIVVGGPRPDWVSYEAAELASAEFTASAPTVASDPCIIYFTSGTTSKPKMVLHTHRSYPVGHLSTLYWMGLREGDIHFNISSPGWAKHAWSCFFAPWTVGATVFVYNQSRFDARRTLEVVARRGVTTLCAPPTAWRSLVLEELSRYPNRLRELVSAGEPLNPEVIDKVKAAWGLEIREGYGQTESTAMLANPPGQPVRAGSMGRPLPGYELALLDEDGRAVEEGEVSVVLRDGPPAGLMAGYAGDPERSRAALHGSHYGTGDVARRDADGYYWFVGRRDDVFKSSDYRISPFELESVLIEHPSVAEAAVVESPDQRRMCVPKAYVTLRSGVVPDRVAALSILRFTRERLAPYQKIRIVEFRELPKTISGKIRRGELRTEEAQRRAANSRAHLEYFEHEFAELEAPARQGRA